MKILYVTSEIYPYIKSGGLADVASGFTKELSKSAKVTTVTPLYKEIDREELKRVDSIKIVLREKEYIFEVFKNKSKKNLFFYNALFDRDEIYGDYEDNYFRFGLFSYAVLEYLKVNNFDILHLNDWQSALVALLVKNAKLNIKTVFTIHNLAFQGIFDKRVIVDLELDWKNFHLDDIEYFDRVNFLKTAVANSDIVTTVSPNYAREILTYGYGFGLHEFLYSQRDKIVGILNRIDEVEFNPESDKNLYFNYSAKDYSNKKQNKKELLKELKLKGVNKILFGFIGRFTEQKLGLLCEILYIFKDLDLNLIILGDGKGEYIKEFKKYSDFENIKIISKYDEKVARRVYASSDFLLMPSTFEPCGLNQMIAQKYGTIPIVTPIGGLKDSVSDYLIDKKSPKGIVLKSVDKISLLEAILRAVSLFHTKSKFLNIAINNLYFNLSWKRSVDNYLTIYKKLLE